MFENDKSFQKTIEILRKHNETGQSVKNISEGHLYERPLMLEFLDECEKLLSNYQKSKKLLRCAVEDLGKTDNCSLCKYHSDPYEKNCSSSIDNCFVWRYEDAVESLLNELYEDPLYGDTIGGTNKW